MILRRSYSWHSPIERKSSLEDGLPALVSREIELLLLASRRYADTAALQRIVD